MSRKFPHLQVSSLLLLLLLIANACKEASSKEPEVDAILIMENEKNSLNNDLKQYAISFASAWSSRDPQAVAAFYTPDGSMQINDNEPVVGRKAIESVVKNSMENFPDLNIAVDSLHQISDGIVYYWTLTGTNTGPGGTGNKIYISGTTLWQLNPQGLVQASIGRFDAKELERQLNGEDE